MNQKQITVYDTIMRVGLASAHQYFLVHDKVLYQEITDCYGLRFSQKMHSFVYNVKGNPKCLQCGNTTKFVSFNRGYRFFCSSKCVALNKAHELKKRDTMKLNHEHEKPTQNKDIEKKRKETLMEKYGTNNLAKIRWNKKSS